MVLNNDELFSQPKNASGFNSPKKDCKNLILSFIPTLFMPYSVHYNRKIISEVILAFTSYPEIPKFAHPVSSTKVS